MGRSRNERLRGIAICGDEGGRRRTRRHPRGWRCHRVATLVLTTLASSSALADIDPDSGIDFVRIGAVGNAPWPGNGNPVDRAVGRGRVDHEYSIGRLEVTTAQWVEFFNAAYDRPSGDRIPNLTLPTSPFWGAVETTPTVAGGRRWRVPAGNELRPVGDISWRTAAIYCNWLHNGKAITRDAFLNGAYDASTFGYFGNIFTDQLEHTPNARYWIPTWDEWLKAAHYDPDKNGPGQGGWWTYSNGTDTPLVGGPPGQGQANFGFDAGAFTIPLGAYPQTQSPWGLLDVAGATLEWNESVLTDTVGTRYRLQDGSFWASTAQSQLDAIFARAGEFPHIAVNEFGFRIASSVPTPSTSILGVGVFIMYGRLTRRRPPQHPPKYSDR